VDWKISGKNKCRMEDFREFPDSGGRSRMDISDSEE
jgi:hypothetical protein